MSVKRRQRCQVISQTTVAQLRFSAPGTEAMKCAPSTRSECKMPYNGASELATKIAKVCCDRPLLVNFIIPTYVIIGHNISVELFCAPSAVAHGGN